MKTITIVTRLEGKDESPYIQESDISHVPGSYLSDYGRNMAREVGRIIRGRFGAHYFDYYGSERHRIADESLKMIVPWINPDNVLQLRKIYEALPNISLKNAEIATRGAKFRRRREVPPTIVEKVEKFQNKIAAIAEYLSLIEVRDTPFLVTTEVWAKVAIALLTRSRMHTTLALDIPPGTIIHAKMRNISQTFQRGGADLKIHTDHIPYR